MHLCVEWETKWKLVWTGNKNQASGLLVET